MKIGSSSGSLQLSQGAPRPTIILAPTSPAVNVVRTRIFSNWNNEVLPSAADAAD